MTRSPLENDAAGLSAQSFASLRFVDMVIAGVGSTAMWNAALEALPEDDVDRDNPIVVRVTDRLGSQIAITRIAGVPVLVGARNNPQRYGHSAIEFQTRWKATPASRQSTISQNAPSAN